MDSVITFMIDVLQDVRTMGPASQLGWLGGIWGLIASPFIALAAYVRRQQTSYARIADTAAKDLRTANKTISELNAENRALRMFEPKETRRKFDAERRDENALRLVKAAEDYVDHHGVCFGEACRILTDSYLGRWEDGWDALRPARAYAMGAIAANPQDGDLPHLLDEIERLIRVEKAEPRTQDEIRQKEERDRLRKLLEDAPRDVGALRAVARNEFAAGRYRIAIAILERAELAVLSNAAYGKGSENYLWVGVELARANHFAGRPATARRIIDPLVKTCAEPPWCGEAIDQSVRHEAASLALQEGDAVNGEAGLAAIIEYYIKVGEGESPFVLATRHEHARAILHQGRAAEAEALLADLLPLSEQVQGPKHPGTLTTRQVHASAILAQGRAAEAEALFAELLPLREKVQGPEHLGALVTRRALACAVLEQRAAVRAREVLAVLPEDGGDPDPLRKGQTAMLRGWLADLEGDADRAGALLDEADAHLAHLLPGQYARRELARYRETRVPGGEGGTTLWATGSP